MAREVFGIDYGDMYVLANDKNTQAALAYLRSPSGTAALEKATALTLQQRELVCRLPHLLTNISTSKLPTSIVQPSVSLAPPPSILCPQSSVVATSFT